MIDKKTILGGIFAIAFLMAIAFIVPALTANNTPPEMVQIIRPTQTAVQIEKSTPVVDLPIPVSGGEASPTSTVILPSPTTASSPTPAELAVLPGSLTAWCIPTDLSFSKEAIAQTGAMPEGARQGVINSEGLMELTIEVQECSFEFSFNQNLSTTLTLQVFGVDPLPFIEAPMTIVANRPDTAYATLTHDYIVNPPYWNAKYRIAVIDNNQKTLWSDLIVVKRGWFPGYCWKGELPDPITLECPGHGEASPNDPWYGWDMPK